MLSGDELYSDDVTSGLDIGDERAEALAEVIEDAAAAAADFEAHGKPLRAEEARTMARQAALELAEIGRQRAHLNPNRKATQ